MRRRFDTKPPSIGRWLIYGALGLVLGAALWVLPEFLLRWSLFGGWFEVRPEELTVAIAVAAVATIFAVVAIRKRKRR